MKNEYLKGVSTLRLEDSSCIGCGMCINVCPHEVFILKDSKVEIIDKDRCMECGACARNCPVSAIGVKSGVGCAYAIIVGRLKGSEPNCSCRTNEDCC